MRRTLVLSVFVSVILTRLSVADAEPPPRPPPNFSSSAATSPANCAQPLWGCPPRNPDGETSTSGPPAQRYERLISAARSLAGQLRVAIPSDLDTAAQKLTEAIAILPEAPEALSLLGQIHLERGQLEAAAPALRRAEELLMGSGAIERTDSQLALALGLLQALEGDLPGALERYLRLLRLGAASHRLLYRTGDVLMALGRLDEATVLYDRACMTPRPHDVPALDVPRACLGFLVALDRGERIRASQALKRINLLDRDLKALRYSDYLSSWERDYHVGLSVVGPCNRLHALQRYLQGARNAPMLTPPRDAAPLSYIRRAEAHVKSLTTSGCPTG